MSEYDRSPPVNTSPLVVSTIMQLTARVSELEQKIARAEGKDSGERAQADLTPKLTEARVREIVREIVVEEVKKACDAQVKTDLAQSTEIQELKKRIGLIQIGVTSLITSAATLGPKLWAWLQSP